MKLNAKEEKRTLHARNCEGSVLLIERERYFNTLAGRNKWEESRVILSLDEIEKLYTNRHAITTEGAKHYV